MASIRREVYIQARPEQVWDALRDVGALHTRLVPGFVVDTRMDGDSRWVTFGNGMVVRELIVDVDDSARRMAWAAVGERIVHHNASAQVIACEDGQACRFVWIADLLPNELAATVTGMIEAGIATVKKTQEAAASGKNPP
jgi:uncharacterized protein YndB with AHSA1/START domain